MLYLRDPCHTMTNFSAILRFYNRVNFYNHIAT